MSRCAYCRKKGADQKTAIRLYDNGKLTTKELSYCSPTCKEQIHAFTESHNRFAPKFTVFAFGWLVLLMVIPLLLKSITGNPVYMEVIPPTMLAIMGAILIKYPLGIVTNRYYERLGIKYTTWFIRITGILMIATGASILWLR
jgi:hypothetical protein